MLCGGSDFAEETSSDYRTFSSVQYNHPSMNRTYVRTFVTSFEPLGMFPVWQWQMKFWEEYTELWTLYRSKEVKVWATLPKSRCATSQSSSRIDCPTIVSSIFINLVSAKNLVSTLWLRLVYGIWSSTTVTTPVLTHHSLIRVGHLYNEKKYEKFIITTFSHESGK